MSLIVFPRQLRVDKNGQPRVGAKAYFYEAGSSTPIALWQDAAFTISHPNPVSSVEGGVWPAIYVDPTVNATYKLVIHTAAGEVVSTDDNIPTPLTVAAIAQQLHPRTPAEIAAGVTPVDYLKEPGDVRRYGAVMDGVTSDHEAFQDADAQSAEDGEPIHIPATGTLATSETLTMSPESNIDAAEADVLTSADIGILVGEAASSCNERTYRFPRVRRATQSTWASNDVVGIRLINLKRCVDMYFPLEQGFTTGVEWLARNEAGSGNAGNYGNSATYGMIINCKYGRRHTNFAEPGGTAFTNSNRHRDGYITSDSGVNPTVDRYGDWIDSQSATPYYNNDIVVDGAIYELNTAGSGVAMPILVTHGVQNRFRDIRDELNDAIAMRCENNSYRNVVESNYPTGFVQNAGAYFDNFVYGLDKFPHLKTTGHYQSPALNRIANEYDGAGSAYFPGHSIMLTGGGTLERAATGFTFSDNAVTFDSGRAVGILVNVENCKRFVLKRDSEAAAGGRWLIACFNDSMTQFTSAGGQHPYAVSDVTTPLQYASTFGGCYQTGGDGNNDIFVAFKSDVKYAWIGVCGGTAPAQLRSIAIHAIDEGSVTFMQGPQASFPNDTVAYATAPPATNIGIYYGDGKEIRKANAAAGATPGYVATTPGVGGTAVFSNMAVTT